MKQSLSAFERLLEILNELREKCPWDRKQTLESLRKLTIEETYELADAIVEKDMSAIKEELGDLLLHIVFYAKIGEETNNFDITRVIDELNKKLVYRHPHVFAETEVADDEEVKQNWELLKQKKGNKPVLAGVPKSLPAMTKANRIQEKVRSSGFDWEQRVHVWDKITEELDELKYEVENENTADIEKEFGDFMFSVINAARLYNIDPEIALEKTNRKFIKRFEYIEQKAAQKNKSLQEMSLEEMDQIWEEAKNNE